MHQRAAQLIHALRLESHPEGGHYREVFRSSTVVLPEDGRDGRPALTSIYFLLAGGTHSKWHVVRSDEVWHHLEGDPLELIVVNPASLDPRTLVLGSRTRGARADSGRTGRPLAGGKNDRRLHACGMHRGPGLRLRGFPASQKRRGCCCTHERRAARLTYLL